MYKLISIDIFANFGMLKKPDTNEPVYLTFNMLHKPALFGILGAIIGESGFKEKGKLPDYYLKLRDLKIGIQPLQHEKGNFQKTTIKYNNTTGFANQGEKAKGEKHCPGATLNIVEQTLIAPTYRCYFLFNMESEHQHKADEYLSKYSAEYLPYLGKNEFSIWWENYEIHKYSEFKTDGSFKISSIYVKDQPVEGSKDIQPFSPFGFDEGNTFSYFEHLPIGYIDIGKKNYQYQYRNFAFTDWTLKSDYKVNFTILQISDGSIIQVF